MNWYYLRASPDPGSSDNTGLIFDPLVRRFISDIVGIKLKYVCAAFI